MPLSLCDLCSTYCEDVPVKNTISRKLKNVLNSGWLMAYSGMVADHVSCDYPMEVHLSMCYSPGRFMSIFGYLIISLKPGFHMIVPVGSKKCSDDHKETLPRRSQTIRTTETTSIAWIELSFYPDDRVNFEAIRVVCDRLGSVSIWSSWSSEHFVRRLGRSGRSYGNQA